MVSIVDLQQRSRFFVSLLVAQHDSEIDVPCCHAVVGFDGPSASSTKQRQGWNV
jgi:hypothetical protein